MKEEDEIRYRSAKQLEIAAQNLVLSLPAVGSPLASDIRIEDWRIGALAFLLGSLMESARQAATRAYMVGKE